MKIKIVTIITLLVIISTNIMAQRIFKHPGGLLCMKDLDRIKAHVENKEQPWLNWWNQFQKDPLASATRKASPSAEIGGSNGTRQVAAEDAYCAMLCAVEWHVTGQTKYADCAANILSEWGKMVKTASAELYQFPCRSMCLAAEMLRDSDGTFYEGWNDAERDTFLSKVKTVFYPACSKYCTYESTLPSWYIPAAESVLAAGVLLDDTNIYNEGMDLLVNKGEWGNLYGAINENGQMREMGRDNVHAILALNDLTEACQIAWNQGDDLYAAGNNRLLKGLNYWCQYNSGHEDTPYEPMESTGSGYHWYYISTHNNGFRLRPDGYCFETVYHHYREVKGLNIDSLYPYIGIMAKLARPDSNMQMLGFGTLFYTIAASTSPEFSSAPSQPQNVKAESGYHCVYLSWQHPAYEDARGFKIYRSTDGISFTLLTTWDYYTNNKYKDEDVEPNKNYYYKIVLLNKAGDSKASDIVSAISESGTEELPKGWTFADINTSATGSAIFSTAEDSTFVVNGSGSDIGGTADSQGFLYKKMIGDAMLSVRLTSTNETFFKVGIMVRANLNSNAQRVGMTLGELGNRLSRMCVRDYSGNNTTWTSGDDFTYAPVWMKIERKGNTVSTYQSRDGSNWFLIGSATVSMPTTIYVGMGVCTASQTGSIYQAVFDHVSLSGNSAEPASVPLSPKEFKVYWSNSQQATLNWKSVEDADSFIIYRSSDHILFNAIDTIRATGYVDQLPLDGTYYYQVSAKNDRGEGKPSSSQVVTTYEAELLKGAIIGTNGSWGNNSRTTNVAAVDGDVSTFFDAAESSGAWVGYDMGLNALAQIVAVKYAPRSGFPARMIGGQFQVATKSDFSDAVTIATVSEQPEENLFTRQNSPSYKTYRYMRYLSPDNGYCNVAEIQFYGHKTDVVDRISSFIADNSKIEDIYDICGRKICSGTNSLNFVSKGIYIIKKGKNTYKVIKQ